MKMSKCCKRPLTDEESEEILRQLKNSDDAKKIQKLIDEKLVKNDLPAGSIQVYQPWKDCNFDVFDDNSTPTELDCLKLPIEDFALFGPTPHETLITVECQICKKIIKASLFSQHLEIKHTEQLRKFEQSTKAPLKTRLVRIKKKNKEIKGKISVETKTKKSSKSKEKKKDHKKKLKPKSLKTAKNLMKTKEHQTNKEKPKTKLKNKKTDPLEIITIDDNDNNGNYKIIKSSNSGSSSKISDAKQSEAKHLKIVNTSGKIDLSNNTNNNTNKDNFKKPIFTVLKGDYCGGKITKANQVQPSSSPAAIYSAHPSVIPNSVFKKPLPVSQNVTKNDKFPAKTKQINLKSAKKPNSKQTSLLKSMDIIKPNCDMAKSSQIPVNNSVISGDLNPNANPTRIIHAEMASAEVSYKDSASSKRKSPVKPKVSFAEKFKVKPGLFQKLNPDLVIKDSEIPAKKLKLTAEPVDESDQKQLQQNIYQAGGSNNMMGGSNEFPIATSSIFLHPQPHLSCIKQATSNTIRIMDSDDESISIGQSTSETVIASVEKPQRKKAEKLCKNREYHPDKHCGVRNYVSSAPCCHALTCRLHSIAIRRMVPGRSKPFDQLLHEYKVVNNIKDRSNRKCNKNKSSDKNINEDEDGQGTSSSSNVNNKNRNHVVKSMSEEISRMISQKCGKIVGAKSLTKSDISANKIIINSSLLSWKTIKELNHLIDIELGNDQNGKKSKLGSIKDLRTAAMIRNQKNMFGLSFNLNFNTFPKILDTALKDRKWEISKCKKFYNLNVMLNKQKEKILCQKLLVRRSFKKRKSFSPSTIAVASTPDSSRNEMISIDQHAIDSNKNPIPLPPTPSFITFNKVTSILPKTIPDPAEVNNGTLKIMPKIDAKTLIPAAIKSSETVEMIPIPGHRKNPNANIDLNDLEDMLECPEICEQSDQETELARRNIFGNYQTEEKNEADILWDYLNNDNPDVSCQMDPKQNSVLEEMLLDKNKVFPFKPTMHDDRILSGTPSIRPISDNSEASQYDHQQPAMTITNTEIIDKLNRKLYFFINKKGLARKCGEYLGNLDDLVSLCFNNPIFYAEQYSLENLENVTDDNTKPENAKPKLPILAGENIGKFLSETRSLTAPETDKLKSITAFNDMNQTKTDGSILKPVKVLEATTQTPAGMISNQYILHKKSFAKDESDSDSVPDDIVDFLLDYEERVETLQKKISKNPILESFLKDIKPFEIDNDQSVCNLKSIILQPDATIEQIPTKTGKRYILKTQCMNYLINLDGSLLVNRLVPGKKSNPQTTNEPKSSKYAASVKSSQSIPVPPNSEQSILQQTIGQPTKQSFYTPNECILNISAQDLQIPVTKQRLTNQKKTLLAQQSAENVQTMFSRNQPITIASNPTILNNSGGSGEPTTFTAILCGPNDVRLQYDQNTMVDNAQPGTSNMGSYQMITIPISNDQPIMIPMNVAATGQAPQQLNTIDHSAAYHQQNNANANPQLVQMIQQNPIQNRIAGNVIAQQPQLQSQSPQQQLNTIQCTTLPGTTQAILLPISNLNSMQSIYILNPSGDTVNALSINPSSASINTMVGVPSSNIQTASAAKNPIQMAKLSSSPMGL